MGTNKLTVGIPFHNVDDYVIRSAHAVASNCREVGAEFQLLLADDYSSPDCKVVQGVEDIPEAKVIKVVSPYGTNPNLGLAVNMMLDQVRPDDDFYWNVESDVYPELGCLRELIKVLEQRDDISAVRGSHVLHFKNGIFLHPNELKPQRWGHLTCFLVRGKHARDKRIRIEEDKFRLWFADLDYGCVLTYYSRLYSVATENALFKHLRGSTIHSISDREWLIKVRDGVLTGDEANSYSHNKWKKVLFNDGLVWCKGGWELL